MSVAAPRATEQRSGGVKHKKQQNKYSQTNFPFTVANVNKHKRADFKVKDVF